MTRGHFMKAQGNGLKTIFLSQLFPENFPTHKISPIRFSTSKKTNYLDRIIQLKFLSWFFTNYFYYLYVVNVIREQTIREFYIKHPDAKEWLITWLAVARKASWRNPHDIQQDYPTADQVGDQRMVFNVKGNKYRLVVRFSFQYKHALIKWFGPHAEYDKIDVLKV